MFPRLAERNAVIDLSLGPMSVITIWGSDVTLYWTDAGLGERGVFEYLEDVAVVGDHARESPFGDAEHVEQRLGLVEVGNRSREYRAQRVAQLARPLLLGADDDQLVGGALSGFEPRFCQRMECVAGRHRCEKGRGCGNAEKRFHSRS